MACSASQMGVGGVTTAQRDELSQYLSFQDITAEIFRLSADTKVSQSNESFRAVHGKVSAVPFSLCSLRLALRRNFGFSRPSKLPVQFLPGEQERRRPAMRTVMRVMDQMALGDESRDLVGGEAVAGLHGGVACHQA